MAVMLVHAAGIAGNEPFMCNVCGRNTVSLNGEWSAIIDQFDRGEKFHMEKNRKPVGNTDFYEYSFDGAMRLKVPGDWNYQKPELKYYEGTVWYGRHIDASPEKGTRQFLYFAGVSTRCKVFLNGVQIAEHEGAFLPFQAEVTNTLRNGDNFLAVMVNNRRTEDSIPALDFDWWNYGGITRDVMLVKTPEVFISDYFISLDRRDSRTINASISLSKAVASEVSIEIPELKIKHTVRTDDNGEASISIATRKLSLWSPESPKLYDVTLRCGGNSITDRIGFRTLSVDGTKILLNGKPFFGKSVSLHEELPQRAGRACTKEDAEYLLGEVKKIGANMVRLAHYPQNEHIVRLAEEMGIVLWEEIPLWQKIKFSDEGTLKLAMKMYSDMLYRDRNRCAVCFWGLANETQPSADRNAFLTKLHNLAKGLDTTRLYTIADNVAAYDPSTGKMEMNDPMADVVDVVAINKYLGWYAKWEKAPADLEWNVATDKPLIISEFGGESLYGRRGDADKVSSWSEDYQAKLYRDNLTTFANIKNLAGISPWLLFDFCSPRRMHPEFQSGWNRKGLISEKGEYKQAWYIIHDYYTSR